MYIIGLIFMKCIHSGIFFGGFDFGFDIYLLQCELFNLRKELFNFTENRVSVKTCGCQALS